MRRPVELVGAQRLDDVGDRVFAQQHRTQNRLLGRNVLRGEPVTPALSIGLRPQPIALIGELGYRHPAPPPLVLPL
jgi:hypothetical protein